MTRGPSAGNGWPPVKIAVTRSGVQLSASTQHLRADAAAWRAFSAKKSQEYCIHTPVLTLGQHSSLIYDRHYETPIKPMMTNLSVTSLATTLHTLDCLYSQLDDLDRMIQEQCLHESLGFACQTCLTQL